MDAVALASVVTTGLVGLGGLAFGAWNGFQDRANRMETAEAERSHSRAVARSERLYEARSKVYEEVLYEIHRVALTMERTVPIISADNPQRPPDPPSEDDYLRLESRVAAFGSHEVLELLETLRETEGTFFAAASIYVRMQNQGERDAEITQALLESRKEARQKVRNLESQIRDELAEL